MHYVIGDVHGCYDEMIALLSKIEKEDKSASYIFVGDFIDRGPKVDKVLEWCVQNITSDGKYQAVRGNHEEMVLENTNDPLKWAGCINMPDRKVWNTYIELFFGLPYDKRLEIQSVWGKINTFRIVHAFYEYGNVSVEGQHQANLWKRSNTGNVSTDEIVIHGHTPTLDYEYILEGKRDTKPGMVSYRYNDINVDGGCVFAKEFPMYPAMLCAIRLEDLEEIYPYTVAERFMQASHNSIQDRYQEERMENYFQNYLNDEGMYRKLLLKKIGHPDYQDISEAVRRSIHREAQYEEEERVYFQKNKAVYEGVIEAVHLPSEEDIEQPYYDILIEMYGTFVLCEGISEQDIIVDMK